jgi:putative tryptophan/tyrosine transport system substrate-binding protein
MTAKMQRREFITLLGGAALTRPHAARAQQAERIRRIGVIMQMAEKDPQAQLNVLAFQKGLLARGLNIGQNLRIDYRFGTASVETIHTAVVDILATSPDVILAHGTAVTAGLQKQTQSVPVVFTVVSDPVGSGFVQSFARPGGNLTGFTNFLEPSMAAKWVELLKEIAPGVSRIGILFNPQMAADGGIYFARPVETSAAALGVKTVRLPVQTPADINQAINAFAQELGGGLIAPPDSTTLPHRDLILVLAARHGLPAIYPYRFFLTSGGLMSYGMDYADVFRRAAEYVDRILKGEKPADLPVQAPTKYELVINLKTAKALGLEVPPMLLARADEVIE